MSTEASASASVSEAMRRALDLALRGWGRVAPNPLVGAVVLANGRAVGEGWHAEYGGPHAEVAALTAAGAAARGATLVVTLEPCAHHGKTPPCTEAILAAGVTRVVAAIRDPDARAKGGLEVLRRAGVAVEAGVLADQASAINAPFLCTRVQAERPFVALKLALSADGGIAGPDRKPVRLSSDAAQDWVHWLRAGFDAIAVGGTTARSDDPRLTVRGAVVPRRAPLRVVFDRLARLPATLRLVASAAQVPTWVVATPQAAPADVERLQSEGVRVIRPPTLGAALAELRAFGVESLLCEGGGVLGAALLQEGLVDRCYRIETPLRLGKGAVPAFPAEAPQAPPWLVVERRALGPDTLLVLDRRLCSPES